jgi:hypothetical protein
MKEIRSEENIQDRREIMGVNSLPEFSILAATPGRIIAAHQTQAPVDVTAIARDLGLAVYEMRNLPSNVSGKIFKDPSHGGKSGFSIAVNASESFVRRRFTVAHEIAHFILHRNRLNGGELVDDTMYRSGLSSREETDANKTAASIIMPLHLIRSLIESGVKDIPSLADRLQVSQSALSIRLNVPVP